eukprot:NODE_227_length_12294_cov_1.542681.p2 type:complete len:401 gc:universal NODE_227_length_12294_cov_1.542681:5569-6771(+)
MDFHSICIRKLPPGTQKTQVYIVDKQKSIRRSEWQPNRNLEFAIKGTIASDLVIGVDYYLDGRLMHVKKQMMNVVFIGPRIPNISFPPIHIFLQNHKGYYMESGHEKVKIHKQEFSRTFGKTNQETCDSILSLKMQIDQIRKEIEIIKLVKDLNVLERIQSVRSDVERRRTQVSVLQRKIISYKTYLRTKEEHFIKQKLCLSEMKESLLDSIALYSQNRQNLLQIISDSQKIQMSIIRDISFVYHIDMSEGKCFINGSFLPNSVFMNVDYREIMISLGQVAHLISLLSEYLFIDLKYPIICRGSHSFIMDPITQYPEQFKLGKMIRLWHAPDSRLDWSVYLLNKDIELIMFLRGQRVRDLRKTLPNLKLILDVVQEKLFMESETVTTLSDNYSQFNFNAK